MRRLILASVCSFALCESVNAFCGFYVASEGGTPFNESSKVVLARQGDLTTITMSSDVGGAPEDFALVIPVPTTVQRSQVRVIQSATIDHLDSYSTPRLVEYFDPDPCAPVMEMSPRRSSAIGGMLERDRAPGAAGVRVEAEYSVGEYDIQVLSAGDSSGLIDYLNQRHYRIPAGAAPVIGSYIGQRMQFFVAKVNLGRVNQAGGKVFLRPIQVDYRTPKFMLPIRLGTVNAKGAQDMIVLALTQNGRVETTNYQTRRMPTGTDVPLYVKDHFADFYRAVFERQVQDADGGATFLEYAWDMGACDPCSAPPLSNEELKELGASWIGTGSARFGYQAAFITRLHVRYDREHFPEDLTLQETRDRESYQVRYVMHHAFTGRATCEAAQRYTARLPARYRQEARNAAELTDGSYSEIVRQMNETGEPVR